MVVNITNSALPNGFVDLKDIDPSIKSDLKYAKNDNFLARKVNGYNHHAAVIMTKEAALALKKAQVKFNQDGFTIVVYDSYRPQRAVDDFVGWAKDAENQTHKSLFYPRIDKSKVFELGYIAYKSGHSRGSTVDVTIIKLDHNVQPIKPYPRNLSDGFEVMFLDDGTVDMGTSFDLFDKASHYENDLINLEHKKNRTYLKNIMESCGFKPYPEEWWHFTLDNEPFPDKYFDFIVE